ncbi:MAG TPA: right-handed parallel beta-helix repeat-containing protein [Actinomycetota bacterium]|nr:right-handed parallel beta-helix repeat-containing protein [Actinomycetota bacterium]
MSALALGHVGNVEPGIIHSCVASGGTVRIIAADGTCRPNETALDWNAQGVLPEPASVLVDCAAGDTVGQALADTAFAPSVQITVLGSCTESVGIQRDDVALIAAPEGGTLLAPSPDDGILHLKGTRIVVDGLTLSGGAQGLIGQPGASFDARELHITGTGTAVQLSGAAGSLHQLVIDSCEEGISAGDGASVSVGGGSISNCVLGVGAQNGSGVSLFGVAIADTTRMGISSDFGGSVAMLDGTTISNAGHIGAFAFGGSIFLKGTGTEITGSTFDGLHAGEGGLVSLNDGARVAGNHGGVSASNGGAVLIQEGVIVEDNTGVGVHLEGVSSLSMQNGVIVRNNTDHGIFLSGTSVAEFGDGTNEIVDNGGWGILCAGPPSVSLLQGEHPGTVTGNFAGDIGCPSDFDF